MGEGGGGQGKKFNPPLPVRVKLLALLLRKLPRGQYRSVLCALIRKKKKTSPL